VIPAKTPRFQLPYIDPSQEQPEVKINEAWDIIDAALPGGSETGSDVGSSDSGGPGSITVEQRDDSPEVVVNDVTTLRFKGATVESETGGVAVVTIPEPTPPPPSSAGSPIIIVRNMREARRHMRAPTLNPSGVAPGTYLNANIVVGADGRLTAATSGSSGGGSSPFAPGGVTGSLACWFQSDVENLGVGQSLPRLYNSGFIGYNPIARLSGGVGTATQLNSKPLILLGGTLNTAMYLYDISLGSSGSMLLGTVGCTIFFVGSAASHAAINGIVGSVVSGAVEFDISTTGALIFVSSAIAILGTSSATVPINTFFQGNVTYSGATGNIAFKIARTAAGTVSAATHPLAGGSNVIMSENSGTNPFNGLLAELIIYQRVLSGAEITLVESYLNTKWGV